MDVCSHIGFSVNDVNSLHAFRTDTLKSSYGPVGDFLVDEPAYGATKILKIQVEDERNSVSIPSHEEDVMQTKNACLEAQQSEIITNTHQSDDDIVTSEVITHDDDDNDDAKSINTHCSRGQSLPERLKPVSAMKGSREKRGLSPPKQLTVKWAPDVYDPLPMPSLHIVINRPHRHGKKKSKSKQRNRSKSRGSKSKDKQQDGKDTLCEHVEEVSHVSEIQQPSDIDFLPGFTGVFSEGSFVNSHGSVLHLSSVTETT
ncbi:hypothetical protein HanRHA438_Chr13g0594261 [Helianthus annuus]|nr:hypothetical protein HanHA300_Chr13g0478431 [Helianthus annuus]KAJ0663375.1 hypothetical protein HanLR1_Chr13g0480551 [Helianthus annuus]KAJ0670876.1 hypothetical protein HanOQP8_Chr13g0479481 [Helianthus annuus]KAJ0848803.1 hypothetical protein HanPSC8_Chr13g0561731 [Helianthus annuus]KAJ0857802.1 hypothetical protein HanRHA438_Chr13g0594261 [Helianthus annuus]